ncbi:MAG: nucleotidyltransferase domain-containing protein [Methylococcales bacterium]|jgi:predicted nucleotidyltransferase|nr:nucleotidyltransferase domain-containing protein [Methylococcales bacterium]MBT4347267.1 nucleotidyltransferase domain-containing protein [Methylococcales bacterium]MBT4599572.1 nucleotidyltransferase domain-containing protein [Methylococcales bacterium]MBT6522800.1 nucleotidyltransferase domain-containing protein [Methylococcales bacterium]MBT6794062.1 nucleotidyltransferase domain-containing protein [Methylococcales bacterium]
MVFQEKKYHILINQIKSSLPNVLAIYAFGSQITGHSNEHSDLDLAVLIDGQVETFDLWDLASQLVEIAGCDVDLLNMRLASTVMQYQILQTGRTLWAKQPDAGIFESFILSEKLNLDVLRKELLEDIDQRGSIYAR